MFCPNCGNRVPDQAVICTHCGVPLPHNMVPSDARSRLAAGLLGIFLGGFGVHRFYLGFIGIGVLQVAVTLVTCGLGSLWGFVEGIVILARGMNTDADGRPLRD
jgi:TM2 domain-containing membrane protein YozV